MERVAVLGHQELPWGSFARVTSTVLELGMDFRLAIKKRDETERGLNLAVANKYFKWYNYS